MFLIEVDCGPCCRKMHVVEVLRQQSGPFVIQEIKFIKTTVSMITAKALLFISIIYILFGINK